MQQAVTKQVRSFFSNWDKIPKPSRLRVLLRTARHKIRKPLPLERLQPAIRRRQEEMLHEGRGQVHQLASIYRMARPGPTPTIVLGGFVPESTESVYMVRGMLGRQGSLYCVNYPRQGFSMDLLFAQLDDLVDEITLLHGRDPVVMGISFGCGLALEWLRRRRVLGGHHPLKGIVLVSPVACIEDLLAPGQTKGHTLLGRAIAPYLNPTGVDPKIVERSRAIFIKMFEAGAQNREALADLMTRNEVINLRDRVFDNIRGIEFQGACERVNALRQMLSPRAYFDPRLLPLSDCPTLILYAEREDSVLDENSPTRAALESAHAAYFPRSRCVVVRNPKGAPVQHASLIFHGPNFTPHLQRFYQQLRRGWLKGRAA